MLTEPTIEKLQALHLGAMAAAWIAQREDPKIHEVDFDSRFGMIVDAEHLSRDNKRLARALREAKLRIPNACIEDIDYAPRRELERALVRQLGTCAWIASDRSPFQSGPIFQTVTANTRRQRPRSPKIRSIVANGILQTTSQTSSAAAGAISR